MKATRKQELATRWMQAMEVQDWTAAMDVECIVDDLGDTNGELVILTLCDRPHLTYGEAFELVVSEVNA